MEGEYLRQAITHFSGYLAADELYDGPFCILILVDSRRCQRLTYRVLEHAPQPQDIQSFLEAFRTRLQEQGRAVLGITTDGSPLYPRIIALVFPQARHQVCQFHVLHDIVRAALHALSLARKRLKARLPHIPQGRPSKARQRQIRRSQRLRDRIRELYTHRQLFIQHQLTASQRRILRRLIRGRSELRALRQIIEEVYQLFDRRRRRKTALACLAQLQKRVLCFPRLRRSLTTLFAPSLERALICLDDRMLPRTSNAVERANRRYRKAQESVYSVRTALHIAQRIALDMQRDRQALGRERTLKTLHDARHRRRVQG